MAISATSDGDALLWAAVYATTSPVALVLFGCGALAMSYVYPYLAVAGVLPLMPVVLGLTNAWLFSRLKAEKLGVTRGRAFGAYMLAVLVANILYLAFAAAYGAGVGAI